jgi:uncharacterized protein YlaI
MKTLFTIISTALLLTLFSNLTLAESPTQPPKQTLSLMEQKVPRSKNIIVFPNDKGEVVFNHAIHSQKFKEDDCILCHRTNKPTKDKIMTRFDNHKIAHYFCKGCHREVGSGPTECGGCHNYKKTK